jgi:polyisoprenoid-binding protein YceI
MMTTLETLLNDPDLAGVWNVVPDRSTVGFKVKNMWGLLNVKGRFTEFNGDGQLTGKGAVFGRLDIRTASLDTGVGRRDKHLCSADFFDVDRFGEISVVVTAVHPTEGRSADLRVNFTIKGVTAPLPLPAAITELDDGSIQIDAEAKVGPRPVRLGLEQVRHGGLDGNSGGETRLCPVTSVNPARPSTICTVPASTVTLRILVYSSNVQTRERVKRALGKQLAPDLPELSYVEVATGPMVVRTMDEGGIDLAILDGEATPTGGMGIAKQLKDELQTCPPLVVLTGRRDDAWLANWSRAEAAVPHPLDPIVLGKTVLGLLRAPVR